MVSLLRLLIPSCQTAAIRRNFRHVRSGLLSLLTGLMLGFSSGAMAQALPTVDDARTVNDSTVGIVFHFEDYYRRLINDMSQALPDEEPLRIVPIIGVSHVQTIYDMLFMQGVDLGVVHSDVLEYIARYQNYEAVYRLINGLVKLYDERIAVIANESIESIEDLAGQKVNFGIAGKGADISSTLLFDSLGIDVEPVRLPLNEALEQVKSNTIAAHIHSLEDPVEELQALRPEDNVRLLAVPRTEQLLKTYNPGELTRKDFPKLIGEDETIQSISVAVMIASYNWKARDRYRYDKLSRFVTALVDNMEELQSGKYEPIWQTVALENEVQGAVRLPMMQQLLDERQRLELDELAEENQRRADELSALREKLTSRINAQLENADDTEELEELLEELERLVEQVEKPASE